MNEPFVPDLAWQEQLRRFGELAGRRSFLIACSVGMGEQVRAIVEGYDDLPDEYEVIESVICPEDKLLVIDKSVFIYGVTGGRP